MPSEGKKPDRSPTSNRQVGKSSFAGSTASGAQALLEPRAGEPQALEQYDEQNGETQNAQAPVNGSGMAREHDELYEGE